MTEPATRKSKRSAPRPSWLLGFLLSVMLLAFAGFCAWQVFFVPDSASYKFAAQQWVLAFAAMTATTGWIIAAIVTIRNTVKQHTITALLQSRLSSVYMDNAKIVGRHYTAYAQELKNNPEYKVKPTDGIDTAALQYILNYFEFIAIGVRSGDLHEGMLQESLLTILKQNVAMSREWINECRDHSPRLYSNLAWLHTKWCPKEAQIT